MRSKSWGKEMRKTEGSAREGHDPPAWVILVKEALRYADLVSFMGR